jgi:hypothetical protein
MSADTTVSFPIRLPPELNAKIDRVVSLMPGKSKQDVIRIALSLGLLDLEQMNYDLEGHAWKALQAAKTLPFPVKPEPLAKVAEEPGKFGTKKGGKQG